MNTGLVQITTIASPVAAPDRTLRLIVSPSMDTLSGVLAAWAEWMKSANRSKETISLRHWHIRHVLEGVGALDAPWEVRPEHLVTWLSQQDWAPATRRSYRSSLRVFYGWARDRGLIAVSPAHALPPVKMPRGRPSPIPEEEYERSTVVAPPLIYIAIVLAGNCGLRRGEIARARREDLQRDLVGWHLHVVGKGGHERFVPVPEELAILILDLPAGWLFPSPAPGYEGRHITPGCMGKWICRHLPPHYTTHSLRHRCATVALDITRDLRAVQELLGHASVATTQLYTLVDDRRIREAVVAATLPKAKRRGVDQPRRQLYDAAEVLARRDSEESEAS